MSLGMRIATTVLTLVAGLLAAGAASAAPAAAAATDFVTLASDRGHYPGLGETRAWSGDEVALVERMLNGGIEVFIQGAADPDDIWSFRVMPPEGEQLAVGTYENTIGWAAPGYPGLSVRGDGRGCNREHGQFRVLELAADLSRIWIVYEHRCEIDDPVNAAWGEIRIGVPEAPADATFLGSPAVFPEWYPGFENVPQPVMLFNTGSSPLTVLDAQAIGSDFRVTEQQCGTLPPRSSCRVYVAFRPGAPGQRQGTLRVQTSAGVRETALIGMGIPGHTGGQVRAAPSATDPDGDFRSFTVPDWIPSGKANSPSGTYPITEVTLGYYQPEPEITWSLVLTAPASGFVEGVSYPAPCCAEPGRAALELHGEEGGVCRGPGRFTVHEAAFDGTRIEHFLATFRIHCGSWIVGTLAWRASGEPPSPPEIPEVGPIAVVADRNSYSYGDQATVTATLPGGSDESVTIFVAPSGGQRVPIGTAQVDGSGQVTLSAPVTRNSTFTAVSGDQEAEVSVQVSAAVGVVARGNIGKRGKYLIFRARKGAAVLGGIAPDHTGDCLYLQIATKRGASWSTVTQRCLRPDTRGVVSSRVKGSAGSAKRFRFFFAGDAENTPAASNWLYARFVRN